MSDVIVITIPLCNGMEYSVTIVRKSETSGSPPLFSLEDLLENPTLLFEKDGKIPSPEEVGIDLKKYHEQRAAQRTT